MAASGGMGVAGEAGGAGGADVAGGLSAAGELLGRVEVAEDLARGQKTVAEHFQEVGQPQRAHCQE